ncbi:hypothetical protein O3G_MSEX011617 [Manduca sexta]|uniref:Uncharacterized protein n=1 Tax=Manduca sexta TaxID=7130 RepID=A0A921ZN04_MANSE|nr:hypothetical protein O3G_MSEX011617 [Manduca sexta]
MECEAYTENGHGSGKLRQEGVRPQHCKQESGTGGVSEVRLGFPCGVGRGPARRQMYLSVAAADVTPAAPAALLDDASTELPFMSNMDEISYWIYTKRAPCLMNYDNLIKKQYEEAHSSKSKPKSVHEVPSPKKKKKRKLSILDDESVCADKQQNVYFDVSQRNNKKMIISSKSDSHGSDIDFNIKNSSIQGKPKRSKLQRSSRTTLHKKNKIITSTPKVTSLRRSLRQAQQTLNNSHLNMSFMFGSGVVNGSNVKNNVSLEETAADKQKLENLAGGDQCTDKKNATNDKVKPNGVNGQFEDLSDMSGFTANYIRSTKVQSKKTPRKLRCKSARNLVKDSKPNTSKESTTVMCANKSVNTPQQKATVLNCSTDSSQNVINLVTTKDNDKPTKVNKSTSLLKFMDTKSKSKESVSKPKNNVNLNISFQSSTSRYPKRTKTTKTVTNAQTNNNERKVSKNSSEFDNSDRKENPDDKIVSRTRSGRTLGLTLRQPENTVLVLSNSTEQVSSMVSMNVASPRAGRERVKRKKRVLNRTVRTRRSGQLAQKDSTRDKSGFAACFSDSDNDSEPLQRKFFCT